MKYSPPIKPFVALCLLFLLSLAPIAAQAHGKTHLATSSSVPPPAQTSLSGRGIALIHVDYETGRVKSLSIIQSTGNSLLDQAALDAFRKHSFPPRTVRKPLRAPMNFTLTQRTVASTAVPAQSRAHKGHGQPPRRIIAELTATTSTRVPRRAIAIARVKNAPAAAKATKVATR